MPSFDVGIDLGTTNIRIYIDGKGIIIDQPAVIAVSKKTKEVLAIGDEAYVMLGKNPASIIVKYPLCSGVISDYELNELMIKEFLKKAGGNILTKPKVCICVHTLITDVERRAVIDAATASGARKVYLIEEPIAALLGSGVDISKPEGFMVVDVGGGTTDVAIISMNGIACSKSIKIGGQKMDDMIARKIYNNYRLFIGPKTAEEVKVALATAKFLGGYKQYRVCGRNLATGLPKAIRITQEEVYGAIEDSVDQIIKVIKEVLEEAPPELAGDIIVNGVLLTGGSLLKGLDERVREETGIKTIVSENPKECVVIGTGKALKDVEVFNTGFVSTASGKI